MSAPWSTNTRAGTPAISPAKSMPLSVWMSCASAPTRSANIGSPASLAPVGPPAWTAATETAGRSRLEMHSLASHSLSAAGGVAFTTSPSVDRVSLRLCHKAVHWQTGWSPDLQ